MCSPLAPFFVVRAKKEPRVSSVLCAIIVIVVESSIIARSCSITHTR